MGLYLLAMYCNDVSVSSLKCSHSAMVRNSSTGMLLLRGLEVSFLNLGSCMSMSSSSSLTGSKSA